MSDRQLVTLRDASGKLSIHFEKYKDALPENAVMEVQKQLYLRTSDDKNTRWQRISKYFITGVVGVVVGMALLWGFGILTTSDKKTSTEITEVIEDSKPLTEITATSEADGGKEDEVAILSPAELTISAIVNDEYIGSNDLLTMTFTITNTGEAGINVTEDMLVLLPDGGIKWDANDVFGNDELLAGESREVDVVFVVGSFADGAEQEYSITYATHYSADGEDTKGNVDFVVYNQPPSEPSFVFDSDNVITVTQNETSIPIKVSGIEYPVTWTVSSLTSTPILTSSKVITTGSDGKAFVQIDISDPTEALTNTKFEFRNGDITGTLSLEFIPTFVGNDSGQALDHFYFQQNAGGNGTGDNIPLMVNEESDTIRHLDSHMPVQILGMPVQITGSVEYEGKNFYPATVQGWVGYTFADNGEKVNVGSTMTIWNWMISDGDSTIRDDLFYIYAREDDIVVSERHIASANAVDVGAKNMLDVDPPDFVLGKVIKMRDDGWTKFEFTGWLAEDVIGFLVSRNE